MLQQLRAQTERVSATAVRVVDAAVNSLGLSTGTDLTAPSAHTTGGAAANGFVWNVMPCVPTTAICTHGKRYERRLQEMLT